MSHKCEASLSSLRPWAATTKMLQKSKLLKVQVERKQNGAAPCPASQEAEDSSARDHEGYVCIGLRKNMVADQVTLASKSVIDLMVFKLSTLETMLTGKYMGKK